MAENPDGGEKSANRRPLSGGLQQASRLVNCLNGQTIEK
jgi:hypothetical protein